MKNCDTDILLATYNGATYLNELLASLERQTDQSWRLIARDDGSTDETVPILRAWGATKGDRFKLLEDGQSNLGASRNFGALLEVCSADYFLPCDQDDVWVDDKVEQLKRQIQFLEADIGKDAPAIVHTDLVVTDKDLNSLSESFWDYQGIRMLPAKNQWKLITFQNVVTGCAMIGNRALLDKALPVPEDAIMHDWWLGLVSALLGRVDRIHTPTVLYRQHAGNALGAGNWTVWKAVIHVLSGPFQSLDEPMKAVEHTRLQAGIAVERLGDQLTDEQRAFLLDYSKLGSAGFLQRKSFPVRHGLFYRGLVRNVGYLGAI